ncbi:MAG: chorismate mutase [Marinomonas sp.]
MSNDHSPSRNEDASDQILASFRKSIDNIDAALIHMLAERFRITQAVGEYKAKVTLPPADPGREKRQVERLRKLSEEADLDPEFSEKFLRFIIDEVIRHHEKARGN